MTTALQRFLAKGGKVEDLIIKYPPIDSYFYKVIDILYVKTGHDYSGYRESTLMRRIGGRLQRFNLDSYKDYEKILQEDNGECNLLSDGLTIHVTEWFRNYNLFLRFSEFMKSHLKINSCHPEKPFRIWSAGCSTGQEPYSLAILFSEICESFFLDFKIYATDMHLPSIEFSEKGIYPFKKVYMELPRCIYKNYFNYLDSRTLQVKNKIKNRIQFALQNLLSGSSIQKQDIIVCRNVIIFFSESLQMKVIEMFANVLRPGGYLWLGKSENLKGDASEWFILVDRKLKLYQRNNNSTKMFT